MYIVIKLANYMCNTAREKLSAFHWTQATDLPVLYEVEQGYSLGLPGSVREPSRGVARSLGQEELTIGRREAITACKTALPRAHDDGGGSLIMRLALPYRQFLVTLDISIQ